MEKQTAKDFTLAVQAQVEKSPELPRLVQEIPQEIGTHLMTLVIMQGYKEGLTAEETAEKVVKTLQDALIFVSRVADTFLANMLPTDGKTH